MTKERFRELKALDKKIKYRGNRYGTPSAWADSDKYKGTRAEVRRLKIRVKPKKIKYAFDPVPKHKGLTSRFIHKPWPFKRKKTA